MKTAELTGAALDWAVQQCEGKRKDIDFVWWTDDHYSPSADWAQGGPIIKRKTITLIYWRNEQTWEASCPVNRSAISAHMKDTDPLIAAMRCYVASEYGYEIEIPEELTA